MVLIVRQADNELNESGNEFDGSFTKLLRSIKLVPSTSAG